MAQKSKKGVSEKSYSPPTPICPVAPRVTPVINDCECVVEFKHTQKHTSHTHIVLYF